MTMKRLLLALVLVPAVASGAGAQAPPPAQAKPPAAQAPAAQPPAAKPATPPKPTASRGTQGGRGTVTFFITNPEGRPIPDATVSMAGATTREGTTNKDGVLRLQTVRAGSYRARAEAEGFIALERDITMRNGLEIEMTLNPAPEPPEPATPAAPPAAAPQAPAPSLAPDPSATLQLSSVVEFFSKNRLGRNEPRSESVVGRAGEATSSLLQVRGTVEARSNGSADEVIYVINGQGQVNSKGRVYDLETGSLVVVPRGVTYSIVNRGRDPLWALSVLAGQAR
jgi:mannose-6-phosphate isomerase-like protein (cupin superfamily)